MEKLLEKNPAPDKEADPMSDEGYEIFLMDLEDYKMELEEEEEE